MTPKITHLRVTADAQAVCIICAGDTTDVEDLDLDQLEAGTPTADAGDGPEPMTLVTLAPAGALELAARLLDVAAEAEDEDLVHLGLGADAPQVALSKPATRVLAATIAKAADHLIEAQEREF